MRIYLVGFMACGKTTVGRCLAQALERPFLDLDVEIERQTGKTINQIFAESGEAAFREIEQAVLVSGDYEAAAVVATGGGTFCRDGNRAYMQQTGVTIWLDLPYTEAVRRVGPLGKRTRPLFRDAEQMRQLFESRVPAYRLADVRCALTGREAPMEIASRLVVRLREPTCGR
jgi:shikimate kinase